MNSELTETQKVKVRTDRDSYPIMSDCAKGKKMKKSILTIILIFMGSLLFPEKLARLPEVAKPFFITIDGNQMYIAEKSTVALYSMNDFKLERKIGKRGEGPSEFKSIPMPEVFPDYLVINNFGKFLLFSRSGDFISEKRTILFYLFIYPVGKNFVALTTERNPKTKSPSKSITLLDKDMKPIKKIASQKEENEPQGKGRGKKRIDVFIDYFRHNVYGDKIYIADSRKGFFIEVFDSMGNKLYEIDKTSEKLKVTDELKKVYLKRLDNSANPFDKRMENENRVNYVFPDYFPAFEDLAVKDGKIYVFTYKRRESKREVVVMDLKGNIIKNSFVTDTGTKLYSISNGIYYYLIDNVDREVWELFGEKI